jgi:hypothetical protein
VDVTADGPFETRLWIGMLAAPLAWVAAEGVGFVTSTTLCEARPGIYSNPSLARVVNLILCGVCLLVAIAGLVVAIDNYRRTRSGASSVAIGRADFMSLGGVFASVIFASAIVLFAIPALVVNVCNQVR